MLLKDHIKTEKLSHKTSEMKVTLKFDVNFNKSILSFKINYSPDRDKLQQESVVDYISILLKEEGQDYNSESLIARIVEDLYDIAVPKNIAVEISEKINNIETQIKASKSQPVVED